MTRALSVWWAGRLVGTLGQTKGGSLEFAYAKDWIDDDRMPSLSLSLPKREPAFREKECRPFFAGLLPEETQRRLAAQALGISEGNDFALLDELGGEVAGAIQLLPTDLTPRFESHDLQADALDDEALVAVLDKLPLRPFLAGEDGLRLSLAGAQSKLPVCLVGNKVALPRPGQPTTHILKPPIPDYPGTTENEALVMRLARAIGLNVADAEPRIVADKTFLLITRYDRTIGTDGRIARLHQEDFCQALGVLPHRKYANEGGPNFKTCFALMRQASAMPAKDVLSLMDAALFNLVVGNADAHGKNFSLIHGSKDTRLAPLYDLLSTIHYPTLSPNLAMKIGRAGGLNELDDESWQRFSADSGVGLPYIRRRGRELCEKISEALPAVGQHLSLSGLDERHFASVAQTISSRAEITHMRLPSGKIQLAPGKAPVELVVGPDADLNALTSNEGRPLHTSSVKIVNRSKQLLTGCYLNVGKIDPPAQSTSMLRIAENITLPVGGKKIVSLLVQSDKDKRMLFQYLRTPGFLTPQGKGLLQTDHTFDLLFDSDQNVSARIRCRARVDTQGAMHLTQVHNF